MGKLKKSTFFSQEGEIQISFTNSAAKSVGPGQTFGEGCTIDLFGKKAKQSDLFFNVRVIILPRQAWDDMTDIGTTTPKKKTVFAAGNSDGAHDADQVHLGQEERADLGMKAIDPYKREDDAVALTGEKTPLFAPFISKMHHFTKTGSGQT
jgi:hypothetical protein